MKQKIQVDMDRYIDIAAAYYIVRTKLEAINEFLDPNNIDEMNNAKIDLANFLIEYVNKIEKK